MISTTISPKIGQAMASQVKRANYTRQQLLTPYYAALEIVRTTAQWPSGFWMTVKKGMLNGSPAELFIANNGGFIQLQMIYDGKTLDPLFTVGYYDYKAGAWLIAETATEAAYLNWNKMVRKEVYNG